MDSHFRQYKYASQNSLIKTPELYGKIKDLYDYLDQDKLNLIRDPKLAPCGLLNLGNTCYLNVLLQILYHINPLREAIIMQNSNNKFLQSLKMLFGSINKSRFIYADPSPVLASLTQSYPEIFVPGSQNDFAEVLSILVEELDKSFKEIGDKERKSINKIFQGKSNTQIKVEKALKTIIKQSKYNVINLSCDYGSFEKALQAYKNYEIDQFIDANRSITKATATVSFPQTPALLIFYINRASYENGQQVKNCKLFEFDGKIYMNKKKAKASSAIHEKSKDAEKRIKQLTSQIQQHYISFDNLQKSHKYFESLVQSKPTNQNLKITLKVIKEQTQKINQQIKKFQKQLQETELSTDKLAKDNDSQLYILFALMIHVGKSPRSGHYKTIINTHQDKWFQFNDKIVAEIKYQKILEYKQNGEVCSLFYRRSELECNSMKQYITGELKQKITEHDENLKKKIDEARIVQYYLQAQQAAHDIIEYERQFAEQNNHLFFFKPVLQLICEDRPYETIQKAVISEKMLGQQFQIAKNNFFNKDTPIPFNIQFSKFDLPDQYTQISKQLKNILYKELNFFQIISCYQDLLQLAKIKVKSHITEIKLRNAIAIIYMKGVFYYSMSVDLRFQIASKLQPLLNKIMEVMNQNTDFLFEYIPVMEKIRENLLKKSKKSDILNGSQPKKPCSIICSESQLFTKRFSHWIKRYKNIKQVDASIIETDRKLYPDYTEDQEE